MVAVDSAPPQWQAIAQAVEAVNPFPLPAQFAAGEPVMHAAGEAETLPQGTHLGIQQPSLPPSLPPSPPATPDLPVHPHPLPARGAFAMAW